MGGKREKTRKMKGENMKKINDDLLRFVTNLKPSSPDNIVSLEVKLKAGKLW